MLVLSILIVQNDVMHCLWNMHLNGFHSTNPCAQRIAQNWLELYSILQGFTGITDIAGGYAAWTQNGLPTDLWSLLIESSPTDIINLRKIKGYVQ